MKRNDDPRGELPPIWTDASDDTDSEEGTEDE